MKINKFLSKVNKILLQKIVKILYKKLIFFNQKVDKNFYNFYAKFWIIIIYKKMWKVCSFKLILAYFILKITTRCSIFTWEGYSLYIGPKPWEGSKLTLSLTSTSICCPCSLVSVSYKSQTSSWHSIPLSVVLIYFYYVLVILYNCSTSSTLINCSCSLRVLAS